MTYHKILLRLVLLAFAITPLLHLHADVTLPTVLSSHMVLQCDTALPIWGTADPDEVVSVTIDDQNHQTTANKAGVWSVTLNPMPSSFKPAVLTIKANNTVVLEDILVGEVWLCSGQSNMAWTLGSARDADIELASSGNSSLRLFKVDHKTLLKPRMQVNGKWRPSDASSSKNFSAVGYYFGRDLQRVLNVPVGLIDSSWGGTPAEAWTRMEKLTNSIPMQPTIKQWKKNIAEYPQAFKAWQDDLKAWQDDLKAWEPEQELNPEKSSKYHNDPGISDVATNYHLADFDDSAFKDQALPGEWDRGAPASDGAVWYRRNVEIPNSWIGKELMVSLGSIDDFDITFVNGVKVGSLTAPDSYTVSRHYKVPAELISDRFVSIAVRVFDHYGYGGFSGEASEMFLNVADSSDTPIKLSGLWKMMVELKLKPSPGSYSSSRPRKPRGPLNPHRPGILADSMIAPLVPFAIKGAVWYQGESNASRADQYRTLLPLMISDWRERWNSADLAFGIVQLANFLQPKDKPSDDIWPHLRDAQLETHRNVPNTGLAVITDVGEVNDIHPRNKLDVGRRLARWALDDVYGLDFVGSSPMPRDHIIENGKVIITFDYIGKGLKIFNGGDPAGFTLAGEDAVWYTADAKLITNDCIEVSSTDVPTPVAVRYAWQNNPTEANVISSGYLPLTPFRTDDWPINYKPVNPNQSQ